MKRLSPSEERELNTSIREVLDQLHLSHLESVHDRTRERIEAHIIADLMERGRSEIRIKP